MLEATQPSIAPRILVVDDDQALLRMISLALVSDGFRVTVASDGTMGLDAIEGEQFDLLVLDLQMPGMDGRTMFRELRLRGYTFPVLVLSAYGADAARVELNAEAAMAKPFDTDDFLNGVHALLSSRETG